MGRELWLAEMNFSPSGMHRSVSIIYKILCFVDEMRATPVFCEEENNTWKLKEGYLEAKNEAAFERYW